MQMLHHIPSVICHLRWSLIFRTNVTPNKKSVSSKTLEVTLSYKMLSCQDWDSDEKAKECGRTKLIDYECFDHNQKWNFF